MFWGNSKKGGRVSFPQEYKGLLLLYWGRAAGYLAEEEYVLKEKNILSYGEGVRDTPNCN